MSVSPAFADPPAFGAAAEKTLRHERQQTLTREPGCPWNCSNDAQIGHRTKCGVPFLDPIFSVCACKSRCGTTVSCSTGTSLLLPYYIIAEIVPVAQKYSLWGSQMLPLQMGSKATRLRIIAHHLSMCASFRRISSLTSVPEAKIEGSRVLSSLRSVPEAKMEGLRVLSDGSYEKFSATRREIAVAFDMRRRDLHQLATKGAHVVVRPSYFLFSFSPFLTGCVSSEEALLISNDGSTSEHQMTTRRMATKVLQQSISSLLRDSHQPFEHSVLEAVLHEDLIRKQVPVPSRTACHPTC